MIVEIFSYVEKLQCGMKLDTRDITMIFWVDKKSWIWNGKWFGEDIVINVGPGG